MLNLRSKENTMFNAREKINTERDRLAAVSKDTRADLRDALDTAADKVQPAADKVASTARAGIARAGDAIDDAAVALTAGGKQVLAAYDRYAKPGAAYVGEQVRKHPAKSLAVAAVVGYGLSKLLSARR
jgi:ElaB/YqjD/DUF883 family membrane-anchored ribosome-binding protein